MDLAAFLEATGGDTGLQFFQALGQGAALTTTYSTLLVTAGPTAGQKIINALVRIRVRVRVRIRAGARTFVATLRCALARLLRGALLFALAVEDLNLHVGIV